MRAYATNSAGTVYGNQQVFTTLNNSSPNVSTNAPTNLLASSVSFTGFASYPIDNPITSRGFCYGTSPLPTLSNSVVNAVSGNGPMSANVSTLLPSTTYYVSSYATNGNGTSYGNEFTFTTCIAPSFTVGQSYGGGTIFYVDCTGIHGLIAANTEYGPVQWGCEGTSISGTLSGIGTGQSNTNLILSGCSDTNFAAKLCDNLTLNTYSDWYLPSYDELETLRVNIGGFANVYIWSSSQKDINDAYSKNLGNPTVQWYFNKSNNGIVYVRPIRSF